MDVRRSRDTVGEPGQEGTPGSRGAGLPLLLLVVLVTAIHLPTLGYGLVWDDVVLVSSSRFLEQASLADLWSHPFWQLLPEGPPHQGILYYRPLVTTGFWLEWHLGGRQPWVLHLGNVLLHAASVLLAALVSRRLLEAPWWWLASALFAFHPSHVESVAFVSGRTDLLCTLFLLGALLVLDRASPSAGRVAAGAALLLLAALAKETAFVFPLLWLAWRSARAAGGLRGALGGGASPLLLLLGLLAALAVLRVALFGGIAGPAPAPPGLLARAALVVLALGRYLGMGVFPFAHSAYHWLDPGRLTRTPWLLVAAASLLLVGLLAWRLRRERCFVLGLAWMLVALLPVLNLSVLPSAWVAERNFFLPSVGFAWAVTALVRRFLPGRAGAVGLVAAIAILAIDGWRRSPVWTSHESLFRSIVADSPESAEGYNGLAGYLVRQGRPGEAVVFARRATELAPSAAESWSNLGAALLDGGSPAEAAGALRRATELDPRNAPLLAALGEALSRSGDGRGAVAALERALALDPALPDAWINLAQTRGVAGDLEGAVAAADRAIAVGPRLAAFQNKGLALLGLGRTEEAARTYREAARRFPEEPLPVLGLAEARKRQGRRAEAREALEAWVRGHPDSPALPALLDTLADLAAEPDPPGP